MKLLHIAHSANPAGGGPIESLRQVEAVLAGKGHSTELLTLDSPHAAWLDDFSFPVHAIGNGKSSYGYTSRLVPWLREHAKEYDAVVVRGIWQYHSLGCWRALRDSNVPYFVFTHGMLDPWFKHAYPLKHAKKWLYWPWADYRVLRDAAAVLFTCEEERVLARKSFWLYRCKEAVVNYGTSMPLGDPDLQKETFVSRYPELRHKRIALFLGRIHPKKGCDLLIEAFTKVLSTDPDWHLVIAGPDQVAWKAKLIALAYKFGVANSITWTDMISGDMKYGALRASEIFVLPSHQENFGVVVAEALACGTPVLISNKVNIWREIQNDKAGLVAGDTLQGTCDLLKSYIDMPDEDKLAMRNAAKPCFEERFEINNAAQSLYAVLAGTTRANSSKPGQHRRGAAATICS